MSKWTRRAWEWLFPMPTARELIEEQIGEAQRQALVHAAAAEHHKALADMYERRVQRLEGMLG